MYMFMYKHMYMFMYIIMYMKYKSLADFRQKLKEAFDVAQKGSTCLIVRSGEVYTLKRLDIADKPAKKEACTHPKIRGGKCAQKGCKNNVYA